MHAETVGLAVFAPEDHYFALAQNPDWDHIETAFQASSPKTSKARSATPGPFFAPGSGGAPL
jgi:hypothetical protein